MATIGIIGGSGLDQPNLLSERSETRLSTPYGEPSDAFVTGRCGGHHLFILPRHGGDHHLPPHRVNYRANLFAFRQLRVDCIAATTATGSLTEDFHPGELVFPDQLIDFTRGREASFFDSFEDPSAGHTPMADPFDSRLRDWAIQAAADLGIPFHPTGTLITVQGPRFSTRAESHLFRQWGAQLINMSVATECALANELHVPYAAIAMVTDYDCWKEGEAPVSHDWVLRAVAANAAKLTALLTEIIRRIPESGAFGG